VRLPCLYDCGADHPCPCSGFTTENATGKAENTFVRTRRDQVP
jgi:hypothetical protein